MCSPGQVWVLARCSQDLCIDAHSNGRAPGALRLAPGPREGKHVPGGASPAWPELSAASVSQGPPPCASPPTPEDLGRAFPSEEFGVQGLLGTFRPSWPLPR